MTVSAATTVRARASGTASVDARGSAAGVATSDEAQAANARRRSADFCIIDESRNRLVGNPGVGDARKKPGQIRELQDNSGRFR